MKKRVDYTPNSVIISAIRQLWMRSRERNMALKLAKNTCARCGKKKSVEKGREVSVVVHHLDGIDWKGFCQVVRDLILHAPHRYEVLCTDCHKEEHAGQDKE